MSTQSSITSTQSMPPVTSTTHPIAQDRISRLPDVVISYIFDFLLPIPEQRAMWEVSTRFGGKQKFGEYQKKMFPLHLYFGTPSSPIPAHYDLVTLLQRYLNGQTKICSLVFPARISDDLVDSFFLLFKKIQPSLKALQITDCDKTFSDKGFKKLVQNMDLEYLFLKDTWVGDEGIEQLPPNGSLKNLDIIDSSQRLTDKTAEHLSKISKLETLKMKYTRITDEGLNRLTQLPNLKELRMLRGRFKLSEEDEQRIRERMPNLKILEIST
jgi:hypothetical protein